MNWTALLAVGMLGCVDKGTPDSAEPTDTDTTVTDTGDTGTRDACQEVSHTFSTGSVDQLPVCFDGLVKEVTRLNPDVDFSDTSTATHTLDPAQMSQATLAALHGQLNGVLQTKGKTSSDTYEAVCERLADAVANQPPPHDDGPEAICSSAEKWAEGISLEAYFTCEPVYLSAAMTEVLGLVSGIDETEAFWARVYSDIGTDPNLIWLPMFLAMHHGGSPSALFYSLPTPTSGGESHGDVSILELGMEVHGDPKLVADFWSFIDGGFDPKTYSGNAGDFSSLDIIIPSRLVWRDGDTIDSWVLGQAIPEPFDQSFVQATGIIDPCVGERRDSEGLAPGGAAGECANSFERMMAVVHELNGLIPFVGTAEKVCDRTAYDYTLP